jgi:hypothetical protein
VRSKTDWISGCWASKYSADTTGGGFQACPAGMRWLYLQKGFIGTMLLILVEMNADKQGD